MVYLKTRYFKTDINLITFFLGIIIHLFAFYGIYLAIIGQTHWKTIIYHYICGYISIVGGLTGAHRLWSHRSYEANMMLQVILLILETYAFSSSAYKWARDHRVHHKFSDTDADPYNIKRGLYFSQIGWVYLKKTEQFKEKVETINLDDLLNDPLVMFQDKHYYKLILLEYSISTMIPWYFWKESLVTSLATLLTAMLLVSGLQTGTINSISHYYGWKPYDTNIEPTFSRLVAYLTLGEGYHNFHHTFPKDYSQSELKWTQNFNVSALLIDFWEYMGWVRSKKVVKPSLIAKRRERTGNLNIKIKPLSVIFDHILGTFVFTWAFWTVFAIRNRELIFDFINFI